MFTLFLKDLVILPSEQMSFKKEKIANLNLYFHPIFILPVGINLIIQNVSCQNLTFKVLIQSIWQGKELCWPKI